MTKKSRNQSLFDFLQCLQLEYITAEIRSKILSSNSDKRYYRKVMGYKKEKIQDIALRNGLPTIFSDNSTKQEMYSKVHTNSGCPNFVYRDEEEKQTYHYRDITNYFCVGAEVSIEDEDGKVSVGVIQDNEQLLIALGSDKHIDSTPLAIKLRGEQKSTIVLINRVSRIL